MATKNEMRQEAIKRLQIMGVSKREAEAVIHNRGMRLAVDREMFEGVRKPLQEMFKGLVATKIYEFEQEHNCLVYSAYVQDSWAGTLINILYVSPYKEDWIIDRTTLEERRPLAYCINLENPTCSEFGAMFVDKYNDGFFKRTDI
jgi:hypothetical protein